jgi:hypothetical protein
LVGEFALEQKQMNLLGTLKIRLCFSFLLNLVYLISNVRICIELIFKTCCGKTIGNFV